MKYRAVLFDLDGTLADTMPVCVEAFQDALEPFWGRRPTWNEVIAHFGPSEEGAVHTMVPDQPHQLLQQFRACFVKRHEGVPDPFPGARELLIDLRASGVKVGLITAKGEWSAKFSITRLGLGGLFDLLATGSPEGVVKGRQITEARELYGFTEAETVCVGDAVSDVRAAREAGVAIVGAAWGTGSHRSLKDAKPDVVLDTFAELGSWLRS